MALRMHAISSLDDIGGFRYVGTTVPLNTGVGSAGGEKQNIMYCKLKQAIVIPLLDNKRQVVLISKAFVEKEAQEQAAKENDKIKGAAGQG